jgi:hypothetical protein
MTEFVLLFRATDIARKDNMGTPERAQKAIEAWMAWMKDLETKGHLKSRGQPLDTTGKVVRGKTRMVTDGPYAEAKDIVLGFIIVEARDIDHAVELSMACPMLEGDSWVEIRPTRKL